jgi:hypothetical protein
MGQHSLPPQIDDVSSRKAVAAELPPAPIGLERRMHCLASGQCAWRGQLGLSHRFEYPTLNGLCAYATLLLSYCCHNLLRNHIWCGAKKRCRYSFWMVFQDQLMRLRR